jgi:hypothetical protein
MAAGSAKFLNLGDGAARTLKAGQFAVAPAQAALDQRRIDEAIKKGIDFVKGVESIPAGFAFGPKDSDELILLTTPTRGCPRPIRKSRSCSRSCSKARSKAPTRSRSSRWRSRSSTA